MKKRIFSLLVAVVLVVGTTTTAFAADKVTAIESGVFVSSIDYTSGDEFEIGSTMSDVYEDFSPGATINIFLDPTKFVGAEFTPVTGMSASALERAGVSFRIGGGNNANLIKNVAYKEKTLNGQRVAMIQVQLVDSVVTTEEKEFDTILTVYANKVKQQSIEVAGNIGGETKKVTAGESYIYLGDGSVAEATESITNIEVDAGNNVLLNARMHSGKKYYAVARVEPTTADIELMNNTAAIDSVYYLDTTGFNAGDATVKIKDTDKLFVYDVAGKLLGNTEDTLALSSKYYLTTEEVALNLSNNTDNDNDDGDTGEPPLPTSPEPGDITNPNEDGGTTDPNHIPDTGVGVMPKIAMFAMLAGLATIGGVVVTSKKSRNK